MTDKKEITVDKPINIFVCKGVEGPSIYINDYRVCGNKPWGGGEVWHEWKCTEKDILTALGISDQCSDIIKQRDELLEMLGSTLSWLTSYPGGGAINKYDQARNLINKIGEK